MRILLHHRVMTRSRPRNRYGVLAVAIAGSLVLLSGCATSVGHRAGVSDSGNRAAVSVESHGSGVTADGRSFGPLPTSGSHLSPSQIPDFVRVVGDHKVVGYADSHVLLGGGQATSPAEALSQPAPRQVSVYASDGTTVVDTFTVNR